MEDDYKGRFVEEYRQLATRIDKLDKMLRKNKFGKLGFSLSCPTELLREQLQAMRRYADVLKDRAVIEDVELDL